MPTCATASVRYLTLKGGFVCVGQYGRSLDALANLPTERVSVVLMDIKMRGMDGIECVRRLKEKMPDMLIIMLTVFEDEDLIFDALMAGATGYLLKRQPPEQLLEAIHELSGGRLADVRHDCAQSGKNSCSAPPPLASPPAACDSCCQTDSERCWNYWLSANPIKA